MHAFSLKNKLQKCIRKFCFSQWAFESNPKASSDGTMKTVIFTCVTKPTEPNFFHFIKETSIIVIFLTKVRNEMNLIRYSRFLSKLNVTEKMRLYRYHIIYERRSPHSKTSFGKTPTIHQKQMRSRQQKIIYPNISYTDDKKRTSLQFRQMSDSTFFSSGGSLPTIINIIHFKICEQKKIIVTIVCAWIGSLFFLSENKRTRFPWHGRRFLQKGANNKMKWIYGMRNFG